MKCCWTCITCRATSATTRVRFFGRFVLPGTWYPGTLVLFLMVVCGVPRCSGSYLCTRYVVLCIIYRVVVFLVTVDRQSDRQIYNYRSWHSVFRTENQCCRAYVCTAALYIPLILYTTVHGIYVPFDGDCLALRYLPLMFGGNTKKHASWWGQISKDIMGAMRSMMEWCVFGSSSRLCFRYVEITLSSNNRSLSPPKTMDRSIEIDEVLDEYPVTATTIIQYVMHGSCTTRTQAA